MKIVCDSCSTKYSISDDKVRGKVFKIRCKKCSHIIVVKGNAEAAPAAAEAPTDAVWHLVVDGDQVGPLNDADVRARLSRNEISPENYVWKEGFTDWLRLAEVPEFADVAQTSAVAGELFSDNARADETEGGEAAAGDLAGFFGAGAAGQEAVHSGGHPVSLAGLSARNRVGTSEPAAEDDAFAATVTASAPSEAADLFGAVAPVPVHAESGRARARGTNGTAGAGGAGGAGLSARHDGGRVENLTAQRSENSVLFSLSNLQSLAAPAAAPAAKPGTVQTTEGSGLIDIRAMAASTLRAPAAGGLPAFGSNARSAEDDLPAFGAFSSAAPVLLAIPTSSGPPKWVYALIGLGGLILVGVLIVAISILGKPVVVEAPPAAVVAPPPEAKAPAKPAAEEKAPAKIAAADLPPREGGEPAAEKAGGDKAPGAEKAGIKGKRGHHKGAGAGESKAGGAVAASGASAAPAETPEKAKAPSKGSLDDLLEGALNARGKSRAKVSEEDGPAGKKASGGGDAPSAGGGGPLAKAAVVNGMNGVKGKVSACYNQFKVPGMAMVNVVIGKNGKVSSAAVTGKFAGTPTGTCVENAVKTASFPPSDGLSTPYPFNLR